MRLAIVGFGEIGQATANALLQPDIKGIEKIILCDIDKAQFQGWGNRYSIDPKDWRVETFHVQPEGDLPVADAYIITVWDTTQVNNVLRSLSAQYEAGRLHSLKLVSIESTTEPGLVVIPKALEPYTVFFPHRFNPDDAKHGVLNVNRVMGSDNAEALTRGLWFYMDHMEKPFAIVPTTARIAQMSKLVENTYRYIEIVVAQELATAIEQKFPGEWERIRECANTKWNIDIRESRDGVKGKCLPKDIALLERALGPDRPMLVSDPSSIFAFMQQKNADHITKDQA